MADVLAPISIIVKNPALDSNNLIMLFFLIFVLYSILM